MKTKKILNVMAFGVLIATAGCVTGPPVESRSERRVERSLQDVGNNHPDIIEREVIYTEGYRAGGYWGYPYDRSYRYSTYPYYQGYREVYRDDYVTEDSDKNNYDQHHDRMYISK